MAFWYGQECGSGKGAEPFVNLPGWGGCIDFCQEIFLHLFTSVFHKIWFMLLKYNLDFTGFILCKKLKVFSFYK